jgi:hypothetical protein
MEKTCKSTWNLPTQYPVSGPNPEPWSANHSTARFGRSVRSNCSVTAAGNTTDTQALTEPEPGNGHVRHLGLPTTQFIPLTASMFPRPEGLHGIPLQ